MTDDQRAVRKERILSYMSSGASFAVACKAAGIGRRTGYEWRQKDWEFDRLVKAALEPAMPEDPFETPRDEVREAAKIASYQPPRQRIKRQPGIVVVPPDGCLTPIRTSQQMEQHRFAVHDAEINQAARERQQRIREFDPLRYGLL